MSKERLKLADFDNYYTITTCPARVVMAVEGPQDTYLVKAHERLFTAQCEDDVSDSTEICDIESYGPLGVLGIELERFKLRESFLVCKSSENKDVLLPLNEIA